MDRRASPTIRIGRVGKVDSSVSKWAKYSLETLEKKLDQANTRLAKEKANWREKNARWSLTKTKAFPSFARTEELESEVKNLELDIAYRKQFPILKTIKIQVPVSIATASKHDIGIFCGKEEEGRNAAKMAAATELELVNYYKYVLALNYMNNFQMFAKDHKTLWWRPKQIANSLTEAYCETEFIKRGLDKKYSFEIERKKE